MEMPLVPAWIEAALAYATVAIAAMTAFARVLDWVVPQLRAIDARSGARGAGAAGVVARVASALTKSLAFAQRYVPRLMIGPAPGIVAPPERETMPRASDESDSDDPDNNRPGSAGAAVGPSASERDVHPEPHGPFAGS